MYLTSQQERTSTTLLVMLDRMIVGVRSPPTSPGWTDFTIIIECAPASGHCHSVYSVALAGKGRGCAMKTSPYVYKVFGFLHLFLSGFVFYFRRSFSLLELDGLSLGVISTQSGAGICISL